MIDGYEGSGQRSADIEGGPSGRTTDGCESSSQRTTKGKDRFVPSRLQR